MRGFGETDKHRLPHFRVNISSLQSTHLIEFANLLFIVPIIRKIWRPPGDLTSWPGIRSNTTSCL